MQCSKINAKAMALFAEYFTEHSIHTLKLSLANFRQDAEFSELTNLLKPFGSINVRKLEIKVGIHLFLQILITNSPFWNILEKGKIGDALFVAILKAFWDATLAYLKISQVHAQYNLLLIF